ncbi:MAG: serine hydroxymethyltransferase [Candidatus Campbellbacteria bacterium]|nr:serine hydroxymethyltransferase [Candidatus Campbellbacteria bacterium]
MDEIFSLIKEEEERQENTINLIASENYVSSGVREALSSVFMNKYAEGYPGKRYYQGNAVVDKIENLARERALEVFSLSSDEWSVNVQPLSGAQANLAVYSALVPLGETILALDLSHGGHLSHGHKVSLTGKLWKQEKFGVSRDTEMIDYDELKKIAVETKPKMIVAGFTAYPREVDFRKLREIADSVGAYLHADISHIAGLVVGGVHQSPFSVADTVMTTTHKTLRGPRGAIIFSSPEYAAKIDKAVFPGIQGGPHMNKIAAMAVAFTEALKPEFKTYAEDVAKNAKALADTLSERGLRLVSGGTDTHLLLVDTWQEGKGVSGDEAAEKLEVEGIVTNKNTIPFDERSPQSLPEFG